MKSPINLLKSFPDIFFLSFVEGAIVLLIELVAVNLITPFYGVSIYLWSGVLCATLTGLASGYFVAGALSKKNNPMHLYAASLGIGVFTFLMPLIASVFIPLTMEMELKTGITISSFVLVFPCLFMCGLVSPMIIQLINNKQAIAGSVAGTVFMVSTIGGVLMTFIAGLILIPKAGIRATLNVSSALMILALAISFIRHKRTARSIPA
jgi:hypothetical protein